MIFSVIGNHWNCTMRQLHKLAWIKTQMEENKTPYEGCKRSQGVITLLDERKATLNRNIDAAFKTSDKGSPRVLVETISA